MRCRDGTLEHLRTFGYNAVRLPRANINVLDLYTRDGRTLEPLGALTTVFDPGTVIEVPLVTTDQRSAAFSGSKTSAIDAALGIDLLATIIGAMGGSNLGLDVHYRAAKTVTFQFGDVTEDAVEVADIDKYLTDADVSPYSTH